MALGVAALIIVMSVMNGFRAELFDKTVGLNGHAIIQGYDGRLNDWQMIAERAKATPGVQTAIPLIEQPLMASANGRVEGVKVRGNRVSDIRTNPILNGNVKAGDLKQSPRQRPYRDRRAAGRDVGRLSGFRNLADQPRRPVDPGRHRAAHRHLHRRRGIRGWDYEYDNTFIVMPIEDAQSLTMLGNGVGMVEVQVDDPDDVGRTLSPLQDVVRGRGIIIDWRQMNSALYEALEVERIAMFVILSIIVLVAAFNIASSLIMLVRAKTRDIAILRTMGASRSAMTKIFMTVGLTIGAVGIVTGAILGAIFPVLPPGRGQFHPARHRAESVGSLGPLPQRVAVEDRPRRSRRDHHHHARPDLLRHALPGAESGRDGSGPGVAL